MRPQDYKKRLRRLAKVVLENEGRFNFSSWVDDGTYQGKPDLSCGTTACALGWATTVPAFRKEGLRLFTDEVGTYPVCGSDPGSLAGRKVFGITSAESYMLFTPNAQQASYGDSPGPDASASEWADHVERFIARKDELIKAGAVPDWGKTSFSSRKQRY